MSRSGGALFPPAWRRGDGRLFRLIAGGNLRTLRQVGASGRQDDGAARQVTGDFNRPRSLDADRDRHAAEPAIVADLLHGIGDDRLGRDDHGRLLLAEDDVGFDRHADAQRRLLRQAQIDAERLARRVALRRDLGNVRAQGLPLESLGPQEHLLPDGDLDDLLLIDLGDDMQRRRLTDPERHLGRPDNLADFAVAPQHEAVHRRSQHEGIEP